VAKQFGLSANTMRAIDLRYLQRWSQSRKMPALRHLGADEIHPLFGSGHNIDALTKNQNSS
jgi:hypothetical protein